MTVTINMGSPSREDVNENDDREEEEIRRLEAKRRGGEEMRGGCFTRDTIIPENPFGAQQQVSLEAGDQLRWILV